MSNIIHTSLIIAALGIGVGACDKADERRSEAPPAAKPGPWNDTGNAIREHAWNGSVARR